MGVLLQGQVENIASRKDRTIKITLGTQELMPNKAGELFSLNGSLVNVYISENQIANEAMHEIDKTSIDNLTTIKTPSQRLKAVFYILYKKNPEGYASFENYYLNKIEKVIDHYKKMIEEEF
jgi:hypothetical protein